MTTPFLCAESRRRRSLCLPNDDKRIAAWLASRQTLHAARVTGDWISNDPASLPSDQSLPPLVNRLRKSKTRSRRGMFARTLVNPPCSPSVSVGSKFFRLPVIPKSFCAPAVQRGEREEKGNHLRGVIGFHISSRLFRCDRSWFWSPANALLCAKHIHFC